MFNNGVTSLDLDAIKRAFRETPLNEHNNSHHSLSIYDHMEVARLKATLRTNDIRCLIAAEYHDIGKYFISSDLLNKRGSLNNIERMVINSHSYLSYKTLKLFDVDDDICLISLFHHTFAPQMFYDEDKNEITTIDTRVARLSRAIKTIDIYEALTTDRPYHRGVSSDNSIKIIEDTIPDSDTEVLRIIKKHEHDFEE